MPQISGIRLSEQFIVVVVQNCEISLRFVLKLTKTL